MLGAIFVLMGAVGWFRQVLPHESMRSYTAAGAERGCASASARKVTAHASRNEVHRAWLPLKIYPVSAGVKGGLAGGVVMAILAVIYGIVAYHSVWYPINLLAGTLYAPSATPSIEAMQHFNLGWFLFALAMHITMCLLVGLLYGAMLPLIPRRPNRVGRNHRAAAVDGPALPHHRLCEPASG